MLRENRPTSDYFKAGYIFVNEQLTKFYCIPDINAPNSEDMMSEPLVKRRPRPKPKAHAV